MQWTYYVILLVLSSAIVVSTTSDEPRNRRCLSIFTSLFSDDTGRTQKKQVNSQRKPSNNSNRKNNATPPKPPKSKGPKSGSQRVKNTEENLLTNFASDPFGAMFQTTNTLQARTSADKSADRKSQRIQNLSGNRITVNQEPIVKTTKENIEATTTGHLNTINLDYDSYSSYTIPPMVQYMATPQLFNIDQHVYDIYNTQTVSPVIQYMNPIATLPRKYTYKQIKGETIKKIALDNNSDVIVGETRLLRPVYEDDRSKDIIFSEHPYGYEIYPSVSNQQYEEAMVKPNIPFGQRYGSFGMDISNNDVSTYTGHPIIVMDDTLEIMKPSKLLQKKDNTVVEQSVDERPRGDYKR